MNEPQKLREETPSKGDPRPRKRRTLLVLVGVTALIVLVVAGILFWRSKAGKKGARTQDGREAVEAGYLTATLFFGAPTAEGFVTESREVPIGGGGDEAAIRSVVEELARGPVRSGVRVLPEGSAPTRVFLDAQGTVTLDMNAAFGAGSGGATAEALAVRSLTKTLGANFHSVRSLRILVEGQSRETLAGHVPIGEPIPVTP